MQPTLTTTFPSGTTRSRAFGRPSNLEQDLQHRPIIIGWNATAVWGFGGRLSSTAVWNASAGWGTLDWGSPWELWFRPVAPLPGNGPSRLYRDDQRTPAIRLESNLPPAAFAAPCGWSLP